MLPLLGWLLVPLLALLLVLLASQLDSKPTPSPSPSASVKPTPKAHLPTPAEAESPSPAPESPRTEGAGPQQSGGGVTVEPGGGGGGGGEEGGREEEAATAPPERHQPQTFRHLTVHHLHHLSLLWLWNWSLLALVALGALAFLLLRRRLKPKRTLVAAIVLIATLGSATLATVLAIDQIPGRGTYVSHPVVQVDEHFDSDGDRFIELEKPIDHYHPPLELDVALLVLAALLTEAAIPPGQTLVQAFQEAQRRRRARRRALAAERAGRRPAL